MNLSQTWGERTWEKQALSTEETLKLLKKNLKTRLKPHSTTHVFEVTAMSPTPEEAMAIANAVVTLYKAEQDYRETMTEHQKQRQELEAKVAQQEKGIREEMAARDNLKSALAKKGIPVPTDDQIFENRDSLWNPKDDPQLNEYRRNEFLLGERQSFLSNFQTQLSMVDLVGVQNSHVRIIALAEAYLDKSRRLGEMSLVVLVGIFLGAGVATLMIKKQGAN